jgi:antitoxin VapB
MSYPLRIAKLFPNGQSQAVRLPKEFRFKGSEVLVTALDGAVILLPKANPWAPLLASLSRFSPDFGAPAPARVKPKPRRTAKTPKKKRSRR